MKILLGNFNAEVGREDILKPTVGNKSPHEISNDKGVNRCPSLLRKWESHSATNHQLTIMHVCGNIILVFLAVLLAPQ
jgi:hypothetical protein